MKRKKTIYRRKDGCWEARYCKGRNQEGSIIYGSCYVKTYSEAKRKLEQAKKTSVHATVKQKRESIHLRNICDDWLQLNHFRLKPSTCVKYQTSIEKYIQPILGDLLLSNVTTEIVGNFSAHLITDCGLATKTVQDILTLLHTILEYGNRQHPGQYTKVEFVYPKKNPIEMRALSIAEQKRLTDYLLEDISPCKFGILLTLCTGMRIGELCALQWKHIDLQEQTIKVEATMQRLQQIDPAAVNKTRIIVDSPKTPSSIRIIPLGDLAQQLCIKMNPGNKQAYVLTGASHYMEPRLLQYHFQRYAAACNLENVTFHTLRHTFATRCVEVNFEIKSLSEILGHANTAITLNRYVHCSMAMKRENMRKLDILNR